MCEICGNARPGEVKPGLVRYRERLPGERARFRFDSIMRCIDREACRGRTLLSAAEYWSVDPGDIPRGITKG